MSQLSEEEFVSKLDISDWPWSKSDMFHWIPVLNRMDQILERICTFYTLPNQSKPLSPEHKYVLTNVLMFTRSLWDNVTNRTLYSSYDVFEIHGSILELYLELMIWTLYNTYLNFS